MGEELLIMNYWCIYIKIYSHEKFIKRGS
jgi:hypothetical protein